MNVRVGYRRRTQSTRTGPTEFGSVARVYKARGRVATGCGGYCKVIGTRQGEQSCSLQVRACEGFLYGCRLGMMILSYPSQERGARGEMFFAH